MTFPSKIRLCAGVLTSPATLRIAMLAAGLVATGCPALASAPERPAAPDALYGPLFTAVQRARIFPDQKTFVDCVPRTAPTTIRLTYEKWRAAHAGAIDPAELRAFVEAHFLVPEARPVAVPPSAGLAEHIGALWPVLTRAPDVGVPGSSLLSLPNPYVVPGGRFREIYYWDSYFTMLGLRESGRFDLIEAMVGNFAALIERYGMVPNGNRTYYLSRSQPPFFSLMVDLLAERQGNAVYLRYLPALRAEYRYWMDETAPTHHVVRMPDGAIASRYWDQLAQPRDESYVEDASVAARATRAPADVYRDLRSAAESGWDFSTRWFADGKTLETIRTTRVLPVDLNALLQHLEETLALASALAGDRAQSDAFQAAAVARRKLIHRHFWSDRLGCFVDYDLDAQAPAAAPTLAAVVPLFLGLATPDQAESTARVLRRDFLRPGGLMTTLIRSGQQWDAPNGWAPLQWMAVSGLERYGQHELAAEIAHRWMSVTEAVYRRTGKLMEKYNVEDLTLAGGGGEYPTQDGFGWTNGVYLALARRYRDEGSRAGAGHDGGNERSADHER
jgi:alpha,alpha-trehalase